MRFIYLLHPAASLYNLSRSVETSRSGFFVVQCAMLLLVNLNKARLYLM
jgi:hypothetical protein